MPISATIFVGTLNCYHQCSMLYLSVVQLTPLATNLSRIDFILPSGVTTVQSNVNEIWQAATVLH